MRGCGKNQRQGVVMKKFLLAIMAFLLCATIFAACDSDGGDGTQRKITFEQAGCETIVKYVEDGGDLTDIPDPVQKPGYTVTWSIQNFEDITEDITVTAVEKANEYKIFYAAGEGATIAEPHTVVTFDAPYELLTPVYPGYTFTGWVITESGEAFASGEKYSVVGDVYLTATWEANDDYVNPFL